MSDSELRRKAEEYVEMESKKSYQHPLDHSQDGFIAGYEAGFKEANRWIPCSERLPEKDGKYAAIFHGVPNHWYELYYDQHLKYWLDGQGGKAWASWGKL